VIIGKIRPETKKELPKWVTVVPYINDITQLVAAYTTCDVVLQPSKFDGMPNVLLEAMATERTILASPVGGKMATSVNRMKSGFKQSGEYLPSQNLK